MLFLILISLFLLKQCVLLDNSCVDIKYNTKSELYFINLTVGYKDHTLPVYFRETDIVLNYHNYAPSDFSQKIKNVSTPDRIDFIYNDSIQISEKIRTYTNFHLVWAMGFQSYYYFGVKYEEAETSILYQLKKNKVINSISYSLIHKDKNKEYNYLCFGKTSTDIQPNYQGHCSLSNCIVNHINFDNISTYQNRTVKISNYENYISLPREIIRVIELEGECGQDFNHCNCDSLSYLPNLTISFGEFTYAIPIEAISVEKIRANCYLLIKEDENEIILGRPFLQLYNITVDYENDEFIVFSERNTIEYQVRWCKYNTLINICIIIILLLGIAMNAIIKKYYIKY